MAAPALCRAFSQNAWRRDLCSNCFRSKDEHKAAAAARQKTPSDAARLAATAAVKSILKGSSKSSNSSGKKGRGGVSFHKEESQVIGYGGDDEIHSEDEGNDPELVETPSEADLEREKAEQQELERLTKANTDFNSVVANLQLESITQEKQAAVKSGASGIPVPGGRSPYAGPLRLGLGSKDGDGNKKTLLVSVRPFGSEGEEVSKPVVKTKILVTNGYGNGTNSTGSARESKDSMKPLVNGTMTNGIGHSSSNVSKEASVKVNVPPSNGNESKSVATNGVNLIGKGSNIARVTGKSDAAKVNDSNINGKCDQNGARESEEGKGAVLSSVNGEDVSGESVTPSVSSNAVTSSSNVSAPVPANRSFNQQQHSNGGASVVLKNENEKMNEEKSTGDGKIVNGHDSNPPSKNTNPGDGGVGIMPPSKESLNGNNKQKASLVGPSSNIPLASTPKEGSRPGTDGNEVVRQVPIPAERKILLAKPETPLEESAQSLSEAAVNSKANSLVEQEKQLKEKLPVETPSRSPLESLERSSTVEVISREMKEVSMAVNEKICDSLVEEKTIRSSILPVSQMPSSQPLKKAPLSKNVLLKQESQESQKKPEEPSTGKVPLSTKAPNNTISTTPQKPALLSKRPAPSILKMGVPAGWHSKNTSQKNSALIQPAKDSNEEKTMSERANVVNGVIKNQQSTGATVGQEKPLKPVNTIAKLRANFVNNNLKIIAESAAKIVNGTRYGTKNAVADEIPMSKSSVMNLSMRPISTNSRTSGKSFHADDYELKDQRIKGLSNMDKVSNSFPSIRAKGSGPDIRELLRTPEKENENIEFQVHTINQKNPVEPGVLSAKKIGSLDAENIEKPMQYSDEKGVQKEGDMKKLTKEPECHEESSNGSNEVLSESSERSGVPAGENLIPGSRSNQLDLKQTSPQNNIESNKCSDQFEEKSDSPKISSACGGSSSQASPNNAEDTMKAESPAKVENGLDKTPPGEKNRKKGIVRRILFKGGNEIYRKAGEMVRSVRRSNESKDDVESTKEAEAKDTKDHALISKKSLNSKAQGESVITAEIAANPEVTVPFSAEIEEAVNPMVTGIGGGLNEMPMVKQENTSIEALPAEGSVKEISEPPMGVEVDECKGGPMVREESPENTTSTAKSTAEVLESSHPPLMSPRPSFLHGKSFAAQPWSLQSPSRNAAGNSSAHSTPGMRTERAASVSAVLSNHGVTTPSGQRGRLASLPALESEGKSLYTNHSAQGIQITLRKPGPIISGMKPAIPAKPSKILEASSVRQGANQQLSKPIGERKGSTSMQSTPGSVGRSAGKRQAPKPPGMDASQKRKCDPSEMGDCSKEIISSSNGGGVCDATLASNNVGHLPDASQSEQQMDNSAETHIDVSSEDRIEEIKRERLVSLSDGTPEEEIEGYSLNQTSQLTNLSNSGEEEITDDSVLAPRGTHFVKNQALNASKSSSRVARETERRQMLIQLQSTNNRGPVPLPDGSGEVPSAIMQATSNAALSARQRSASLGRGVGVASPRPPLPGGSLGRFAGEGAALTIVTSTDVESPPDASAEMGNHDDVLSHSTSPVTLPIAHDPLNIGENAQQVAASPIRSRSEGSLAVRLPMTPSDDGKLAPGAMIFETPGGVSGMAKGEEVIYDSPSGLSSKKKRHTVRGFLKFLRRGSLRDDPSGTAFENRDEVSVDSEPKTRPVIVHPMELDGACVEVVKGGGIDVRRRLEEENALETTKSGAGGCSASSDQLQSSPRRPASISIAPPRPPPVMHSPSSPSLSSSSSSSSGSTPIRPRPPPPPRGLAPVPPSPGGSGQKPARPPPPKPAHLMRLGLIDREVPGGSAKNSGDGIYANLGEVRATLAPCKPQRTASMREVLGSTSGKANGEAPTPRVIPRNAMTSSSTETPSPDPSSHSPELKTVASSSDAIESTAASIQEVRVPSLDAGNESVKCVDTIETSKSDKLSWNVGAEVSLTPPSGMSGAVGQVDISTDSSSEEENSMAPPLPLAPPPSLPPPPSPPPTTLAPIPCHLIIIVLLHRERSHPPGRQWL
ncbi:serine-rich adhesin for platelets isoform X2 [Hetaerina americana]|uniref:serine-rich adhesin for platelets isoform X2 n=1 Tax=Hetaerina americana TaxID=62018 RepID=UPI003A7F4F6A